MGGDSRHFIASEQPDILSLMSTESYSIDQHGATSWHSRTLLIGQIKLCKEYFFLSNMSIPNTLRLYQSESCFISSPLTVSSNRGRLSLFQVLPSLQHTNTFNFFSSDCWVFPPLSLYFRLQCKNKEKQDVLSLYCHFLLYSSWRYIQVLPMLRSCMNPPHNQLFCSCICDKQLMILS